MREGLRVQGLPEMRRALKEVGDGMPRELSLVLKAVAGIVASAAGNQAPRGPTGRLAASYHGSSRGLRAGVTSSVPYGPGAEWGMRGKWSGFTKYGPRGERIVGKALDEKGTEIEMALSLGLDQLARKAGWRVP